MNVNDLAWVSLRLVYAWMFIYPAVGLTKQWPTTVQTTALLFSVKPRLFALASVAFMFVGGVMVLLGVYGWLAGAGFVAFNLGGAIIHYRLAAQAGAASLSPEASTTDVSTIKGLANLAVVGHVTSAQKNFVLAAVGLFFFLVGTGPCSVVGPRPPFW